MGTQRSGAAVVAIALLAGALAGCVAPSSKPPPPSQQQLQALREAQAQSWWDSMSTGTTMPEIAVVEELAPDEAVLRQTECLEDANVAGVTIYGPGEWSYNATLGDDTGATAQVEWWTCVQQFPAAFADDGYILSASELEWLYDFYVERYQPCVATMGIELLDLPSREQFISGGTGGYPSWLPYEQTVRPIPTTAGWAVLAQRCPLPEMLEFYELPGAQQG